MDGLSRAGHHLGRRSLDALAVVLLVCGAVAYNRLWESGEKFWRLAVGGGDFELAAPRWLILLGLIPLLLPVLARSLAALPWQQRLLSLAFRSACIVLLVLGLSQLGQRQTSARVFTVFLVDGSVSVSDASLEGAGDTLHRAQALVGKDNQMAVVRFGRRPELLPWGEGESWGALRMPNGLGDETNIRAALQLAYSLFPPGYVRRVVLISDGQQTRGDLLAETERAKQLGVRVSSVIHAGPPPAEVAIVDLQLPEGVKIGQSFHVVVRISASQASSAVVRLYQGNAPNVLEFKKKVELSAGETKLKFRSVVRVGGTISYRVSVRGLSQDTFEQNNQFVRSLNVPGRPLVLYIEGQPARASYFSNALSAQQFDVELRAASAMPRSLAELARYDFVVLSDVAADAVSEGAQQLIERYVTELGGGFLFAGGGAGYSLGGWGGTTLERILPVRMEAAHRKEKPGVAMALVIDRSGSMTGLPLEMAKAACRATVETLRGSDRLEIIAFDSQPRRFVKMQPARYRERIQSQIAKIQPGGGTGLFAALDAAYQDMSITEARKKHVILLTDGQAESEGIVDLVEAMIAERITVTTVGLGGNTDAELLRRIAQAGGGRFHAVPDPNNLPRIFTRETQMISRQTEVQDWFPVQQTSRADFLQGLSISRAPLLHGYVPTQLKGGAAQQILQSDQGEPVLARWRLGLGWTLAWTSDVKNRWAAEWLQWKDFGRFWGQLLREHGKVQESQQLSLSVHREGNRVVASVDAYTANGLFDSNLDSRLTIEGPLPANTRREVEMRAVAPGRYRAEFELHGYGSFLLSGSHFRKTDSGPKHLSFVSHGSVSQPYPAEYARLGANPGLLREISTVTGGQFSPKPERFFDPGTERVNKQTPLWPQLVLWAMACIFLDVLIRRVRIFDREYRRV